MLTNLELVFRNDIGKEVVITVAEPRSDVTLAQARLVMQDIITKNIFTTKGGDVTQIVEARTNSRDVTPLA